MTRAQSSAAASAEKLSGRMMTLESQGSEKDLKFLQDLAQHTQHHFYSLQYIGIFDWICEIDEVFLLNIIYVTGAALA